MQGKEEKNVPSWVRFFLVNCPFCGFKNILTFESNVSFRLGRRILFARSIRSCANCRKMVRWSVYTDASTEAEGVEVFDSCIDDDEVINEE